MSFDTEVLKDGRGRAIRLDFSIDGFATIYARYGTHGGKLDGTNHYESRIVNVSTLRRGFGQDHIAASGALDVTIANDDGAADWLASRTFMASIAKLRVRVYVQLFDPGATTPVDPAQQHVKQVGEFVLASWPRRDNDKVRLELWDDMLGSLAAPCTLPTLDDVTGLGTASSNPLFEGGIYGDHPTGSTPVQLAFGSDWVRTFPPVLVRNTDPAWLLVDSYLGALSQGTSFFLLPVCTTSDTGAGSGTEISELRGVLYNQDGELTGQPVLDIPRTTVFRGFTRTIWTAVRSPTITKAGRTFKIISALVDSEAMYEWAKDLGDGMEWGFPNAALYGQPAVVNGKKVWFNWPKGYPESYLGGFDKRWFLTTGSRVAEWYAKGYPLSARTQTTAPEQHACDVLKDLVTYYVNPAIPTDDARLARVKTGTPSAKCAGVVEPWQKVNKREPTTPLRAIVSRICQSAELDAYITWDGKFATAAATIDSTLLEAVAADSLVRIDETRLVQMEDWIPSEGERGAPYNRVYLSGGKPNYAEGYPEPPPEGPFLLNTGQPVAINSADRIITVTLEQGWRPWAQQTPNPLQWRQLETTARPRVRFTTGLDGLRLELGDFFRLTWSRGYSPILYNGVVFQADLINYAPEGDQVEVEGVWRDDLSVANPYLLDNQALLLRVASSGGRTASVTDGDQTITFASGSLLTDGVAVGDILVLKDATQAADVFTRFRAMRIVVVTDATHLKVSPAAAADFDAPTPVAVATWEIQRGKTTYPTSISDPANYPSGGDLYGKVAESATGLHSDSSAPNQLMGG